MFKFNKSQKASFNTRLANISTFAIASTMLFTVPAAAAEEEAPSPTVAFTVDYTLDFIGAASGGLAKKVRHLDNLDIAADINLDQGLGWKGGALHLEVSNTSGQTPSEDAGNLQGVDGMRSAPSAFASIRPISSRASPVIGPICAWAGQTSAANSPWPTPPAI